MALIVAASLHLAGCGSNSAPPGAPYGKPSPVSGTVSLPDGSPVRGGILYLTPIEEKVGSNIRYQGTGFIDGKGQFKSGLGGSGNGLVPGKYRVSIGRREIGELRDSNVSRVPKEFTSDVDSKLTVDIEEKDNVLNITLK